MELEESSELIPTTKMAQILGISRVAVFQKIKNKYYKI